MYMKNAHIYYNISQPAYSLCVCGQTQLTHNVKATCDIYVYKIISNRIFVLIIKTVHCNIRHLDT